MDIKPITANTRRWIQSTTKRLTTKLRPSKSFPGKFCFAPVFEETVPKINNLINAIYPRTKGLTSLQ
jgi:hypothetical protein